MKTAMRCLQKEINRRRTHASKHIQYSIRCKYATHCGTYIVDCKPTGMGGFTCEKLVHFVNYFVLCCSFVC